MSAKSAAAALATPALPLAPPSTLHRICMSASLIGWLTFGVLSAIATSSTFAFITTFLRPENSTWGIKFCAAALRLSAMVCSLLHSEPRTYAAAGAGVMKLLTGFIVEASLLFAQPLFSTIAGGVFGPGEATRQLVLRLSRSAWLSTEPSLADSPVVLVVSAVSKMSALAPATTVYGLAALIFLMCLAPSTTATAAVAALLLSTLSSSSDIFAALAALPGLVTLCASLALYEVGRREILPSSLLGGWARFAASLLADAARKVCFAVLYCRLGSAMLEFASGLSVTSYLAALPTQLFMSRQELSLFHWSIGSSAHLALILLGDFCMSNALSPPRTGALGCALLGAGLLLAGVTPTFGFALHSTAWTAHAACDALCQRLGVVDEFVRPSRFERSGPPARVSAVGSLRVIPPSDPTRGSEADLKLRVLGPRQLLGLKRPVYAKFDRALTLNIALVLLVMYPSATHGVLDVLDAAGDHALTAVCMFLMLLAAATVRRGVSAVVKALVLFVRWLALVAMSPTLLIVLALRIVLARPSIAMDALAVLHELAML